MLCYRRRFAGGRRCRHTSTNEAKSSREAKVDRYDRLCSSPFKFPCGRGGSSCCCEARPGRPPLTFAATLMTLGIVQAADAPKYPDWRGAWARWTPPNAAREIGNGGVNLTAGGQPSFDQTKPWGFGQQAPLTPEYQKVLEDSIADQAKGGEGNFFDHAVRCLPGGMPLMMIAFRPLEFVVTPETTYILIGGSEHYRRIFTDGRDWPKDIEPTFAGYSIGKWIDTDGRRPLRRARGRDPRPVQGSARL